MNFILGFNFAKFDKFCPFSKKAIKLVLLTPYDMIYITAIRIKYNTL